MEAGAKIRVRPAVPLDMIDILVVRIASWREAYRGILPQKHLDAMRKGTRVEVGPGTWVVEHDRIVVGYCFVSPGPGRTVEIKELYLHPNYWRMGLGRALVEALSASLAARRVEALVLWVLEANAPGRAFYESSGFTQERGAVREFVTAGEASRAVFYRVDL